ncbi:MAG TPA: metalloregulator ArsR/SmtB family transcription factor [Pseudonocardia sp.]
MRARNNIAAADRWREPLDDNVVTTAAEVLRLLADATRLHLLALLVEEPQDVTTLTAKVNASRSSVSQHLGRLRWGGLVTVGREGRRMVYRLSSDHVRALVAEAYAFAEHLDRDSPHDSSDA